MHVENKSENREQREYKTDAVFSSTFLLQLLRSYQKYMCCVFIHVTDF